MKRSISAVRLDAALSLGSSRNFLARSMAIPISSVSREICSNFPPGGVKRSHQIAPRLVRPFVSALALIGEIVQFALYKITRKVGFAWGYAGNTERGEQRTQRA